MEPIIFTPRLKLTLITKAERGSLELQWLHKLRCDEQATWWSIYGRSKSIEDTEKIVKNYLPTREGEEKTYRVVYAVHEVLESGSVGSEPQSGKQEEKPTQFIGFVNLKSLDPGFLVLPVDLTLPVAAAATTLTIELAYSFLPNGWGKGYATESVDAVFKSCKKARSFWAPFSKVYVRGIVNEENPASLRVMAKLGMKKKGIYEWTGEPVFIAGEWHEQSNLHIFGVHLLE